MFKNSIVFLAILLLASCGQDTKTGEAAPKQEKAAKPAVAVPTSYAYFGSTMDGKLVLANSISNTIFVLELEKPNQVPVFVIQNGTYKEQANGIELIDPKNGKSIMFTISDEVKSQPNQQVFKGIGLLRFAHDDLADDALRGFAAGNYADLDLTCSCIPASQKKACNAGGSGESKANQTLKYGFKVSASCAADYFACCMGKEKTK